MPAFRPFLLAALTLATAPAVMRAQGACDINDGSPFQVNSAKLYVNKAASGGKADEKPAQLKNAVKVLTQNGGNFGNPVGRNFLLARALYEWARIAPYDSSLVAPRDVIGYADGSTGNVDLAAAVDSALAVVEAAQPGCTSKTGPIRSYFYSGLYNRALALTNAGNVDSARALARRASSVNPHSVGPYQLLAVVAEKEGDRPTMLASYAKVLSMSTAGDTASARYRKSALYNSAVILQQQASAATGTEKQSMNDQATALFKQYAAEFPDDPNAAAGLAKVQLASGNAAAAQGVFTQMLAATDKYTDTQLFEAATSAQVSKQYAVAQQLYEAGLKKNPYYRDALYNLANSYVSTREGDKMLPVAMRLLSVEPATALNDSIVADAYKLKARSTTDQKLKSAYSDSIRVYLEAGAKLKSQAQVTTFTHAANGKHTVGGNVRNLGTAPASYTVTVEFLDATGAAIGTGSTKVGPVAPNAAQPFSVSVTQVGVVAWRVKVAS